jgi:predicted nucleotidyltransferase component of viral defense system
MRLHLSSLAAKTKPVFGLLAKHPALDAFVLVGGTAMALQLSHRLSEDLDFWSPAERLSIYLIDSLMSDLKKAGHAVAFTTSTSQITQFRVNTGEDLRLRVQDWSIDGVKVQFFCPQDIAFGEFKNFERVKPKGHSFSIMGLEGIFAMKAYVIHRRVKSRDLVDLWYFIQDGKSVQDIFQASERVSPSVSADYAKAVLRGEVPLDANDEGFELLLKDSSMTLTKVYDDFATRIDAFEVDLARRLVRSTRKD